MTTKQIPDEQRQQQLKTHNSDALKVCRPPHHNTLHCSIAAIQSLTSTTHPEPEELAVPVSVQPLVVHVILLHIHLVLQLLSPQQVLKLHSTRRSASNMCIESRATGVRISRELGLAWLAWHGMSTSA
jgi:hypothetical protein